LGLVFLAYLWYNNNGDREGDKNSKPQIKKKKNKKNNVNLLTKSVGYDII
jgi:hypothetical protein